MPQLPASIPAVQDIPVNASQEELVRWLRDFMAAVLAWCRQAAGVHEMSVQSGPSDEMPTANGTHGFWWADDSEYLYLDTGAWTRVGGRVNADDLNLPLNLTIEEVLGRKLTKDDMDLPLGLKAGEL